MELNILYLDNFKFSDDEKLVYLFSLKNYEFAKKYENKILQIDVHVYKMKDKYDEYSYYMQYCKRGFILIEFSDEIYLILGNEVLKNLILYVPNSTEEKNKLDNYLIKIIRSQMPLQVR